MNEHNYFAVPLNDEHFVEILVDIGDNYWTGCTFN